ncbi:hypothetical protein [Devosia sp. RR2S18]|uniref:hypothetical protein n=1 Tax=Devosia rhizosphaerae TaxID=3049774 RepID=UPI0025422315|nr:hypothetical protein [Devosia sp. RR2S18]WIJ25788.1 hypothetical protein QOV41_03225 [Devosia sp. RR2S18]
MEDIQISVHAQARIRQRGLKAEALDALITYGSYRRRGGAELVFMDKKARARAKDGLGVKAFARIESSFNTYVVVGDEGTLVTCAKRLKRLML